MRDRIIKSLYSIIENLDANNIDSLLLGKSCKIYNPANQLEISYSDCHFMDYESHDFNEIGITLEGNNLIELQHNYYMIDESQVCIIEKNSIHRKGWFRSDSSGSVVLWINLAERMIRLHTSYYKFEERKESFGMDIYDINDFLVNKIIEEIKMQKCGYHEAVSRYFGAFLTLLARKIASSYTSMESNWSTQIIHEVKTHIQNHLDSKLSLREISNKVAISPNYLSVLFKQVTGKNLINYIHDTKTQEAKKLLKTTGFTLSDIAERLGFYDQFHFSKVFKEYAGMTPSLYRGMSCNK